MIDAMRERLLGCEMYMRWARVMRMNGIAQWILGIFENFGCVISTVFHCLLDVGVKIGWWLKGGQLGVMDGPKNGNKGHISWLDIWIDGRCLGFSFNLCLDLLHLGNDEWGRRPMGGQMLVRFRGRNNSTSYVLRVYKWQLLIWGDSQAVRDFRMTPGPHERPLWISVDLLSSSHHQKPVHRCTCESSQTKTVTISLRNPSLNPNQPECLTTGLQLNLIDRIECNHFWFTFSNFETSMNHKKIVNGKLHLV